MMLAQVDPVVTSTAGSFAEKFGFPALLVIILMFALWKVLQASREEREKRDVLDLQREEARRTERKEDRAAHLEVLGKHTEAVAALGTGFNRLEQKVDTIGKEVEVIGRDVDGLKVKVG